MIKSIPTLVLLQLILVLPISAQSAESILKKVSEQHEAMVKEVNDMKIVMRPDGDIAGFDQMITYYKKEMVDGKPMFKTHTEFEGGMGEMMNAASTSQSMDMLAFGAQMHESLKDVAEYKGAETIDGARTHVLYVSDMTDLMNQTWGDVPGATEDTRLKDAYFYIDQSKHVIRKISMTAQVDNEGAMMDMNMEIQMNDYRQVGPVYQPFNIKTIMQNPMSPEQRAELTQQREQIEQMLNSLPESQQGQLKKMLNALGGEEIEISMVVEDLQVNKGVPAGYFD